MKTMWRTRLAIVLAVGVSPVMACTSQGHATLTPTSTTPGTDAQLASGPAACKGGTVAVGPISRRFVVTEISDIKLVRGKKDPSFVLKLRPVRRITPAVDAIGAVDKTAVYSAFLKKAPIAMPLGEVSPLEGTSGSITAGGPGALVTFESVERVEASFTQRCGGVAASGVVTSWQKPGSTLIQCDSKQKPNKDVWKEAVALAC